MSKFPLYDSLNTNIKNKDLTVIQKKDFIKKIDILDKNGHELIYALIRIYQMENDEDNTSFILPYNGIYINKDMKFYIENLPNKLNHILYKFIKVHLKKMKEEGNIKRV